MPATTTSGAIGPVYFDDEAAPRIDMKINEYFGQDGKYTAPFNPPFALIDKGGGNPEWANS